MTPEATRQLLRDKLFTIMCENACVARDDLADEKLLREDLQLDSLDFVSIVWALEQEYQINIPDVEIDKLKTIGDIIDALCSKLE